VFVEYKILHAGSNNHGQGPDIIHVLLPCHFERPMEPQFTLFAKLVSEM
jgi:hypothetical protein